MFRSHKSTKPCTLQDDKLSMVNPMFSKHGRNKDGRSGAKTSARSSSSRKKATEAPMSTENSASGERQSRSSHRDAPSSRSSSRARSSTPNKHRPASSDAAVGGTKATSSSARTNARRTSHQESAHRHHRSRSNERSTGSQQRSSSSHGSRRGSSNNHRRPSNNRSVRGSTNSRRPSQGAHARTSTSSRRRPSQTPSSRNSRRPKKPNRALNMKPPRHRVVQQQAHKVFKIKMHKSYNQLLHYLLEKRDEKEPGANIPFLKANLVWYPHPKDGFCPGKVLETFYPNQVGHMVIIEDDEAKPVYVTKKQSRTLLSMDPASVRPVENMDSLLYLNEAAILYNLKLRFKQGDAHCYIGLNTEGSPHHHTTNKSFNEGTIVLVNTFEEPSNGTRVFIRRVCYNMVSSMITTKRNQALVFTGESSSGKTHFAREFIYQLAMQRRKHRDNNLLFLESVKGVFGALDSFLSGKTLRNRKSTRTSKSFELIHTLNSGRIVGGRASLFFMDSTRVVSRRRGEENFGVFYQLCAYAKCHPAFRKRIQLVALRNEAAYLDNVVREERALDDIGAWVLANPAVDNPVVNPIPADAETTPERQAELELSREERYDNARWLRLMSHMKVAFGVTDTAMMAMCEMMATIINIGNIEFFGQEAADLYEPSPQRATGENETLDVKDERWLAVVATQLGIDKEMLEHVLTVKDIKAGTETLTRPLTVQQSEIVRDALAKHLYQRVIIWLQLLMNESLCPPQDNGIKEKFWNHVGSVKLLDMVGFEAFEKSSFEHLCSNYYNEGMNIHYQAYAFRMEQQRVFNAVGGLVEDPIFKPDGMKRSLQALLTSSTSKKNKRLTARILRQEPDEGLFPLFTKRRTRGRLGVFDVISEVGRLKDVGHDRKVLVKMQTEFPAHAKYIRRPKHNIEKFKDCFTIVHYAGAVNYDVDGFLSKNCVALPADLEAALWNSTKLTVRSICMLSAIQMDGRVSLGRGNAPTNAQTTVGTESDVLLAEALAEKAQDWKPVWHALSPKLAKKCSKLKVGGKTFDQLSVMDDNASVASFSSFQTMETSAASNAPFDWNREQLRKTNKLPTHGDDDDDDEQAVPPLEEGGQPNDRSSQGKSSSKGDKTADTDTDANSTTAIAELEDDLEPVSEEATEAPEKVKKKDSKLSKFRKSIRFGRVDEMRKAFDKPAPAPAVVPPGKRHKDKPAKQAIETPVEPPKPVVPKKKRKLPKSITMLTNAFRLFPPKVTSTTALDRLLKEYSQLVGSLELEKNCSLAVNPAVKVVGGSGQAYGHDVRFAKCIKSNNMRVGGYFDERAVLAQLKKTGLVDFCNVRGAIGFPVALDFITFMRQYSVFFPRVLQRTIASREDVVNSIKAVCENMERMKLIDEENHIKKYVVGSSSVLMKHETYRLLEVARMHAENDLATFLQRNARRFVYRTRFLRMMKMKIEIELEAATDACDMKEITKWLTSAKRYSVFTLPYYQAIGRLERLHVEKEVRKELVVAAKARDTIMLYNAISRARELGMERFHYPELDLALKCQFEIEDERKEEIEQLLVEYKSNYKDVLGQLGDQLEEKQIQQAFKSFREVQGRKSKKKRPENCAKAMPKVELNKAFLKAFYEKVNASDKIQEIDFILKYFDGRPDDLVQVLESKYNVKFKTDGSFSKRRKSSVAPEAPTPKERENHRKSIFIKDLAVAKGVNHKSVRLTKFDSLVPKGMPEGYEDEDEDDEDEDSVEDAAYEDEAWGGGKDDDSNSVGS